MFDIGFFELLVIAIVGLVVIGPEKLPGTIRTVALWFGRIKRTLRETRTEMEKQLGADEIRRELHNEQVMRNLEKLRDVHSDLEAKIQNLDGDSTNTSSSEPQNAIGHTIDAEQAPNEQDLGTKPSSQEPPADTVPAEQGSQDKP